MSARDGAAEARRNSRAMSRVMLLVLPAMHAGARSRTPSGVNRHRNIRQRQLLGTASAPRSSTPRRRAGSAPVGVLAVVPSRVRRSAMSGLMATSRAPLVVAVDIPPAHPPCATRPRRQDMWGAIHATRRQGDSWGSRAGSSLMPASRAPRAGRGRNGGSPTPAAWPSSRTTVEKLEATIDITTHRP